MFHQNVADIKNNKNTVCPTLKDDMLVYACENHVVNIFEIIIRISIWW